jgi:hypothetical protein
LIPARDNPAVISSTIRAAEHPAQPDVVAIAPMPPRSTGHLLRPAGGGGVRGSRPSSRVARRILAAEAARVLEAGREDDPPAWGSARFAARVQATRGQLAPIARRSSLADSFCREAAQVADDFRDPARPEWQAVRMAYAIRWLELATGVVLPAWPAWMGSDAARD